jgi:hypothetical protein
VAAAEGMQMDHVIIDQRTESVIRSPKFNSTRGNYTVWRYEQTALRQMSLRITYNKRNENVAHSTTAYYHKTVSDEAPPE